MANSKTKQGRGFFGNSEAHARAGRKGGQATAKSRGPEFYSEIGSLGGKKSSGSFQKGSERAREAGRKGGRARSQS
jgi:general stress protein YciG